MAELNSQREKDRRIYAVGGVLLFGMAVLLAGLWYVQVASALSYAEDLEKQTMRTVRLPAVRGAILDAQGRPVAHSRPSFVMHAYLEEMRPHFRDEWRRTKGKEGLNGEERAQLGHAVRHQVVSNFTAQLQLDQPLNISVAEMQRHFMDQRSLPLPVVRHLTATNVARFMEHSWKVPGLEVNVASERHYPYPGAAHLAGYLKRDIQDEEQAIQYNYRLPDYLGKLGLEKMLDAHLRGQPGTRSLLVNNLGYRQSDSIPVPPQPGSNVVLTLDLEIQKTAKKAMEDAGIKAGAAVVVDVNNGDVIALASIPVFDPNAFAPGISHEQWNGYLNARPSPLINRATQERYPPGSIFKIISGLAALENGLDPAEQQYSAGVAIIGRRRIKDTAAAGHYDFERAFKKSSNTYFIENALVDRDGIEQIIKMGQQFFLGEKTGLLPGQETAGQFPTLADVQSKRWTDGDTANIAIGQGAITVTPLQMALATAAVANGGTFYHPRLIDRVEAPGTGQVTQQFPRARVRGKLLARPKHLAVLQQAMRADVADDDGTGKRSRIEGYEVCGKTGTAEVKNNRDGNYKITWFASYGPFEAPRYAVVVMAERGASGGLTCAPVCKKIYEALIDRDEQTALARNR